RAVTRLGAFYSWVGDKFRKESLNELENGILYLKGGDLTEELGELGKLRKSTRLYPIQEFFDQAYFKDKYIVHLPVK
ncbi:MAG TPA: 16S rRNA (guanine(527)-N(7))-methyltransferase RsmG, partial [Anseongella sp.]